MKYKRNLLSIFIFSSLFFIASCEENKTYKSQLSVNKNDSLWLNFLTAMETKDINYLVKNSHDTIQCAECKLISENDNEFYKSTFVFNNHLDKLMHVKDLKDRAFSITEGNEELQVIYSIKAKYAEEGSYSLIFFFTKTGKSYLFKGMIVT